MNALLNGFHPSFDALSSCADQSDLHAARSRVGRHVARCAACAATVAEIRALGDAARAVELPGAPAGLWAAIERAQAAEAVRPPARPLAAQHEVPVSSVRERDPASVPFRARRGVRRGAALLATAAAVMGALLLPSPFHRTLQAGPKQGRWRFSPALPTPGATVRVRFEPSPSFPAQDRLLLVGRPVPRWTEARGESMRGLELMDSLATLVRGGDGAYAGSFVTSPDFDGLTLQLMPAGGGFIPAPRDPVTGAQRGDPYATRSPTLLVAAAPDGRPRLDVLSGMAALGGAWGSPVPGGYSVADTLIRYYPSEPIGYAADRRVGGKRVIDDVIAYFKRGERQYVKFEQRLMAQPAVSADRELAMVMFGQRISEPTESRRWVMRLVREHPDDPRTLMVYAQMLAGMFNEPGTMPLIRRGLPAADTLWERNGHHESSGEMASIAARAGDTAAVTRWAARNWSGSATVPFAFYRDYFDASLLKDPALRPAARTYLARRTKESCDLRPGAYPERSSREFWVSQCVWRRRDTYADLSVLARLDGNPRAALAYADTAVSLPGFPEQCYSLMPHQRRGEALLAVGDTAAAVGELALRAAQGSWQSHAYADSVGRAIRANVDSVAWARAVSAGRETVSRCHAEFEAKRKAESARLRAAGAPPFYR